MPTGSFLPFISAEAMFILEVVRRKSPALFTSMPQSSDRNGQPGFRPDIEGLRAVAILLVVAFHAHVPGIRGGFVGVDIFFVLSGYLITELLAHEVETTGTLRFGRFYARRARRLLPASFLMLVCVLAASAALLSPLELVPLSQSAMAAAGYVSNMWFLVHFADYFGPGVSTNPLLHTWSLAVEEQFYIAWPMLVLVLMRRSRSRRSLVWVFGLVGVLSLAASIWLTHTHQPIAFFSAPTRAWEFAAGGLATLVPATRLPNLLRYRAVPWLGAAMILAAGMWLTPDYGFPGVVALIPVIGTVLLLISAGNYPGGVFGILNSPPLQWIGRLSYSWYLWHWPVLVFGRILWPRSGMLTSLGLLLGSLGLAWITHSIVENPIRFNPRLMQRPAFSLALGIGLTIAGVAQGMLWQVVSEHWTKSPREIAYLQATASNVDSCLTGFHRDELRVCSFGTGASGTAVLFGDSHAEQWLPALIEVGQRSGFRVVTLLKASCPSASVPVYNPRLEREETECGVWRSKALSYIAHLKPSLVLITNSAGYVERPSLQDPYARLSPSQWAGGIRASLEALNGAAANVVILRDTPRPDIDIPICLSRTSAHPTIFPAEECFAGADRALAPSVWAVETAAAESFAHVHTLDLTDEFCFADRCPPMLNNMVVYRDTNHMTARFAASLAPVLGDKLTSILKNSNAAASLSLERHSDGSIADE